MSAQKVILTADSIEEKIQEYLVYGLNGETLYSQNYPILQISGINMNSLAAYLLFF
jgi:ribonucleotide reductase beta subunit family protein with ferritin-like domain